MRGFYDAVMGDTVPPLPDEEHECARCDVSYAAVTLADAVTAIATVPARVATTLATVPSALLRQRPDTGTWSALEYLCHLRDVYATYTVRLHRARTEDLPALEPMLNDLRARRFGYNLLSPEAVLAELGHNADGFVHETTRCSAADWDRRVTRLSGETRTARWLVRQAMHEGLHHVQDLREITRREPPG